MDIRQEFKPFEANGKTYHLTCNFNVLADMQVNMGDFKLLDDPSQTFNVARIALACMLNNSEEAIAAGEHFTPSEAGNLIPTAAHKMMRIVVMVNRMVREALTPAESPLKESLPET